MVGPPPRRGWQRGMLAVWRAIKDEFWAARLTRVRVKAFDAEIHALTDHRRFAEWEARDRIAAALLHAPSGTMADLLAGDAQLPA